MSTAGLTLRQVRYTNKAFWRNPASAFFTFAFPLMFLVIFTTVFGGDKTTIIAGVQVKQSTFYVASMSAFAVISACFTNIAISVVFARDLGILKRVRGTPLPGSVYLLGRVMHAMIIALILVTICGLFGALVYGARLPTNTLGAYILTVLIGSGAFCALGLAITCIVPNADAAPAIVNAAILPILFLSDIFVPTANAPAWVNFVGDVFPVKHFSLAMQSAYVSPSGSGLEWGNLAVVAAWGIAGLLIAIRFFSWEPRT